jgi:hypothetical protein
MGLTSVIIAVTLLLTGRGEPGQMILGTETPYSETLLGGLSDEFYGLQMTARGDRLCHVKAFFRGAPPQVAHFCRGRVTGWHMRNSAVAATGLGERLSGLAVCFDRNDVIRGLRLDATSGESITTEFGRCTSEFQTVSCHDGWFVQGVQLFFDGRRFGRLHRRLIGVRPLCSVLSGVPA